MKRLLLSTALLSLAILAPKAFAQDYTYNCICLFSEPNGTCVEYTCDARMVNARYYQSGYDCDSRYDRYCDSASYYRQTTYRPSYRDATNAYDNTSSGNYYGSRYDYDWYYRRYTGRTVSSYDRSYYDLPYYY